MKYLVVSLIIVAAVILWRVFRRQKAAPTTLGVGALSTTSGPDPKKINNLGA